MNDKFDAMLNLVNKYLHETWGVGLYDYELRDLIELQRDHTTAKIAAIKYVREATKKSQTLWFALDGRTRHDVEFAVELHFAADMYSDFTAWAMENHVDLSMGEVDVQYLSLKKAKDFVEFIQLNIDKIAG